MSSLRSRALFLVVSVLGAAALSCGGGTPKPERPEAVAPAQPKAQVLVFARGGDSVKLDPAVVDDGESLNVCYSVFDTLVQFKPGTTEVEPGLATRWEAAADGLTWTFHLREGVKFHDGTLMDADAVLFSLLRQHDPAHPFHEVGGAHTYWSSMDMSNIVDTITKTDPLTVVFHLKKTEAPFLANLAMEFASVISPTAAMASGPDFIQHPVGTGPFKFVKWDQEQSIIVEANDAYWGGRPKLDRVVFEVIKDPNIRTIRFQSGAVHLFDNPNPNELEAVRKMPHAKILQEPGLNVGYLAMNMKRDFFKDPRVRIAVNHAIDKQRIVDDIFKGTGTVAKNPLPPIMWGYNDAIQDFAHDKAKARQLLAEAGYPNGFTCSLWYMPVPRPYMPDGKKVAEAIQLDLKEVGITANMVTYDWSTYLDATKKGEHDMALLGWSGDNGDPDNFLNVLLSIAATELPAQNIAFYANVEFNRLITQAKETVDQAARTELYLKAQEVFHEDPPWVCLAHNLQSVVLRDEVSGYVLYPSTRKDFRKVELK